LSEIRFNHQVDKSHDWKIPDQNLKKKKDHQEGGVNVGVDETVSEVKDLVFIENKLWRNVDGRFKLFRLILDIHPDRLRLVEMSLQ